MKVNDATFVTLSAGDASGAGGFFLRRVDGGVGHHVGWRVASSHRGGGGGGRRVSGALLDSHQLGRLGVVLRRRRSGTVGLRVVRRQVSHRRGVGRAVAASSRRGFVHVELV